MIKLSDREPFAEGGNRLCFVHPEDEHKCIKVLRLNIVNKRRNKAVFWKRFFSDRHFDDNWRESQAYRKLEKRKNNKELWSYIPACFGWVDTDLGRGLVTELVRNESGEIAKNLRVYLKNGTFDKVLENALYDLICFYKKHMPTGRDLLDHNMVVQEKKDQLHIFLIDGVDGGRWHRHFKLMSEAQFKRKLQRFYKKMREKNNVDLENIWAGKMFE